MYFTVQHIVVIIHYLGVCVGIFNYHLLKMSDSFATPSPANKFGFVNYHYYLGYFFVLIVLFCCVFILFCFVFNIFNFYVTRISPSEIKILFLKGVLA